MFQWEPQLMWDMWYILTTLLNIHLNISPSINLIWIFIFHHRPLSTLVPTIVPLPATTSKHNHKLLTSNQKLQDLNRNPLKKTITTITPHVCTKIPAIHFWKFKIPSTGRTAQNTRLTRMWVTGVQNTHHEVACFVYIFFVYRYMHVEHEYSF